jgi:hypothetical protein
MNVSINYPQNNGFVEIAKIHIDFDEGDNVMLLSLVPDDYLDAFTAMGCMAARGMRYL